MVYIPEDIVMNIQQYIPNHNMGVNNERLYDEIKLLDPSFSLVKLYYDIVDWRSKMDDIINRPQYSIYRAMDDDVIWSINSEVWKYYGYLGDIEDAIMDIYSDEAIDEPYEDDTIMTKDDIMPELEYNIGYMYHVHLSHPLYRHTWMGYHTHSNAYSYTSKDSNISTYPSIDPMEYTYRHDVYDAIHTIDPNITMHSIYESVVDRINRERRASKYRYIAKHITDVDYSSDRCIIRTDIDINTDMLPYPFSGIGRHNVLTYEGNDAMDIAYDIITSHRMLSRYSIPMCITKSTHSIHI